MKKLRKLQEVRNAYNQASFWRLIRAAYSVNIKWLRVSLWFFSLFSIILFILFIFNKGKIVENAMISCIIMSASLVTISIKTIFSNYYNKFPDLLEAYKKNKIFLRYLIFKSNLNPSFINNKIEIEEIRNLLEIEKQFNENSFFNKNPVTVTCLGFITAILGGAASQLSSWSSGLMFAILFILLLIIFLNYQISEIFQPKSFKDKELRQFLMWLSIDSCNEFRNPV